MKLVNKILPSYAVLPLISAFAYNCMIYWGSNALCKNLLHYDFTMEFDRNIPFIPETILFYFLAYLFWIINYILIGRGEKEQFYRFITADILSRTVCFFFFVFMPTTNVRPELHGNSIWIQMVEWLYRVDEPANLFPSIHCLVSWFCVIGIKNRKDIPDWYKGFSFVFALLICISTQTLKQHYIIDLIGGIVLAEITFWIANHCELYCYIQQVFETIYARLKNIKMQRRKMCEEE